jgi:hypothetical protein
MCEFISWKEMPDGTIRFLTKTMLYHTRRGGELRRHTSQEDWVGHGAIDFYYEDERANGVQKECTDFSSPDNFPPVIVDAILSGEMALPGVYVPEGLLRAPLYEEYKKKCDVLDAEYKKKCDVLDAEYVKKRDALYEEYVKKRDAVYEEYVKKCAPLYAEYVKKCAPLYAECWELFKNPENRSEAWCKKEREERK